MSDRRSSPQGAGRRCAAGPQRGWLAAALLLGVGCTEDGEFGADQTGTADGGSDGAAVVSHDGGHEVEGDGGSANYHQCGQSYPKDPRDDTMTGELVRVVTNDNGTPDEPSDDQYDVLLPQEMLDWLEEQNWIQEHGDWHAIRRWDQGCQRSTSGGSCQSTDALTARGLSRAAIQEGEPGDGYDFLLMHRHMIRGFQEAFPKHVEQIRGFHGVPTSKDDPENPIPWVDVRWSDDQLDTIDFMENIAQHIDAFTSEDDYAKWVQFGDGQFGGTGLGAPAGFSDGGVPGLGGFPGSGSLDGGVPGGSTGGTTSTADGGAANRPGGGIHTGLHSQWAVPGSPSSLTDNNKNVQNYAFWRLHVWIDEMWEGYRSARGLEEDDPDYQQALIAQCEEMHSLGEAKPPAEDAGVTNQDGGSALPAETGVFATQVAPIFNSSCGGSVCHGADSPTLGLALTGAQPSVVREGLVAQQSSEVPLALVEPGEPEQSWLYLKITGSFENVDCSANQCTKMPPSGTGPSDEEIERIRAWIAAGAE